ncbi:relaxosome protein TraM, partial [Escherichia coli]|uniref:relaxosome protein TraM n=1 Tax=Escherichia coli TaxID=562 RepID=UPI003EE2B23C
MYKLTQNKICPLYHMSKTERRQEGATENDATVSSVTSMLIELGLRVYRIQREKKESGFN